MPFITNDFDNQLVDDDEYVGKYKDYVIARKLYVWVDTPFADDDVRVFSSVGLKFLMNVKLVTSNFLS